ncbi:hypothetical protein F4778DRAFT_408020 [Xylariomycetidae sp. FL2044]|nr:hypothetical protein F4778DRAFT_408020 [Xylariomycetidae sp. FL2044]
MPEGLMRRNEAVSALLKFIFSGAIGSSKGKYVSYALISKTSSSFSWSAALEDEDGPAVPIDIWSKSTGNQERSRTQNLLCYQRPSFPRQSWQEQASIWPPRRDLPMARLAFRIGLLFKSFEISHMLFSHVTNGKGASMNALMTLIQPYLSPLFMRGNAVILGMVQIRPFHEA